MALNPSPTPTLSSRSQLVADIERLYSYAEKSSYRSILNYLDHVVIDAKPEPRAFGQLAEPWQKAYLGRIGMALESVVGLRKDYSGPLWFWATLPRGHDKTSSIGRLCSWGLAFCRRKISAIAAAADREQAAGIYDAMETEARLNPWLQKRLEFKTHKVCGVNNSYLKVLSADAYSNFGLRPDFAIFDELTHWEDQALFTSLYTACEKRPGSVVVVITNAGLKNSWQHKAFEKAKENPHLWCVFEARGTLATWMRKDRIDAIRQLILPSEARRLFDNVWVDPNEESGFVTEEEARACEQLGVELGLTRRPAGKLEINYLASIDFGVVKDRCVMVVMHLENGVVVIDRMDVLQGSHERRVPVALVEAWIEDVRKNFYRPAFVIDQHQMEGTIQKYEGSVPMERFEARGGKSNYELAANLRNLIVNRRIAWYPGCGELIVRGARETLTEELYKLVTVSKSYGYRLDHLPNEHDDRSVAVGMGALALMRNELKRPFVMRDLYF